jgi:hypothetical protein
MFHSECEVALYRVRYPRMWVSEGCVCHCQPSDEEHPYLKQVKKQISTQEKKLRRQYFVSTATSLLLTI